MNVRFSSSANCVTPAAARGRETGGWQPMSNVSRSRAAASNCVIAPQRSRCDCTRVHSLSRGPSDVALGRKSWRKKIGSAVRSFVHSGLTTADLAGAAPAPGAHSGSATASAIGTASPRHRRRLIAVGA